MQNQLKVSDAQMGRMLKALNALTHSNQNEGCDLTFLSLSVKMPNVGTAKHAALRLECRGFVHFERSPADGKVFITPVGVEEANRLETPAWKRWLADKTVVVGVVVGFGSAIITAVLSNVITGLFALLAK